MVTNYIHTQLIMYNYKSLKSKLVCDFFFLLYSGILTNQFLLADTHIYALQRALNNTSWLAILVIIYFCNAP